MAPSRALQRTVQTQIPLFLAPAFADSTCIATSSLRTFASTSCQQGKRKGSRDGNKRRGVSAMRGTGFTHKLSVDSLYKELPKPRSAAERQEPLAEFPTNPNHGLYGFFNENRDTVLPGDKEENHGTAWPYEQLMLKNFEDLHALYWVCVKENNIIATRKLEHLRLGLGYGQVEMDERSAAVKKTMSNIRKVLRDRQTAYEQAMLLRERRTIAELIEQVDEREDAAYAELSSYSTSEQPKLAPS